MEKLHLTLDKNSLPMQWAKKQADKLGALGHVGTHLDCYTTVPEKNEYEINGIVIDCRECMPQVEDILPIVSLEGMALILYTGNSEKYEYGTEEYFDEETFLSEETLGAVLSKKPLFIIIDSHGIAKKGMEHISFDKICEANGCHVIENADMTAIKKQKAIRVKILIDSSHPSTGKPCELYYMTSPK